MIIYCLLIPITIADGVAMGYFSVLVGDNKTAIVFLL